MTWLKLSDDFHDESADLSDAAYRTHVEGLGWVMRRETGGYLSRRDVRRCMETADPDEAIAELLEKEFWRMEGDGFRIVHHMQHQPEPEVLARRRELASERQRKKRLKAAGVHDDSPAQSRRDNTRDATRDPGRDGSGRDGSVYQGGDDSAGEREQEREAESERECISCKGEGCDWCDGTGLDPLEQHDAESA